MEVKLLQRPLSILILDTLYRKKSQCSRHCLMSQMSQVKPELVLASQDTASGSHNANREFLNIVLKQQVCFHPSTHNHFVSSAVLAERCFYPFQDKTPYSDIEGDKNFSQFIAVQSILSVSLLFPSQIMIAFGRQHSVDIRAIRFLFEGQILRGDETPTSLGAEDGDEIDVMLSQIGGILT